MRKKIGELLVEAGAATLDDIKAGLGGQRSWGAGQRLGQILVSMGKVTPAQVAKALSLQFDLPFIELPQIPAPVSAMVPVEFQSEHKVVPFRLELDGKVERLSIAVADPSKLDLVDELRFQLGKPIRVFIAATDELEEVLSALRGDQVAELDPLEIDEEPPGEIILERTSELVPQGWFATAEKPNPALPPEWDLFETSTGPAASDQPRPPPEIELDDLLGDGSGAPAPAATLQAVPAPAPVEAAPAPRSAPPVPVEAVPPRPPAPAPAESVASARAAPPPPSATPAAVPSAPAPVEAVASPRPAPAAAQPPAAAPSARPAEVMKFAPPPKPPPAAAAVEPKPPPLLEPSIDFSEEDLRILENLERMAQGEEPTLESAKVKPAQMVASLIRLLMRKGVIAETEFLEELARK